MKTYTVLLSEVTAASAAAALAAAQQLDTRNICTDPDWTAAVWRRYIGIELEQRYCGIARRGLDAVKAYANRPAFFREAA